MFASQLLRFSVDSIVGVKYDLTLALSTQFIEYLRETVCKHALENLEAGCSENNVYILFLLPRVNALL